MKDKVVGFAPFFHSDSKVLILGSFPSVKSRAVEFYYGNPQNAFWRIVSSFFGEPLPRSIEDKKDFLTRNKIALWDIVTECEITASRDDTIKNFKVANLAEVLQNSQVKCILINGGTAYKIFKKHYGGLDEMIINLPSTSPANTRRKDDEWYAALRRAFNRT
ncbi:MAG: DNA-deoxyinosine glycosylase [Clostridia bacterium]|nr:DNA-deoxyinosine glycosylase [Clostridia bacterium]